MPIRLTAAQRRRQIIQKATELFSTHGFEKMTVRQLAGACHITEAALYRYFPSKDRIYNEVLESLREKIKMEELTGRIEGSDSIDDILFAVARNIIKTFSGNRELYRLLLFASLEGHSLAGKVFTTIRSPYVGLLAAALRRLRDGGKIQPVNPLITARCFVGMVMDCALGLHLWERMQKENFDPEVIINNNVPIYVRGLKVVKKS
jgi:AcrR family transcriptional regulator